MAPSSDAAAAEQRRLYVVVFAAFAGATLYTVVLTRRMAGAMPMPGGWTMGMMWMRMPGESWPAAALSFVTMWWFMMLAMMLPSTWPMISIYRRVVVFRKERRADLLSLVMAATYFAVWLAFGLVAYVSGLSLASLSMRSMLVSRAMPLVAGCGLIAAGLYQLTPWKMACLRHCRDPLHFVAHRLGPGWRGAVRLGLDHGLFCVGCCWALMVMQLVLGVMSLPIMAIVAAVIAVEKLLPRPAIIARGVGISAVVGGVVLLVRVGL